MFETKSHAPYNFVPFSDRVVLRYDDISQLPRHDRVDPSLKTGEIHVKLTAKTPVFVSADKRFVRNSDGTYEIPGASLRGVVRETMQILGFGLVRPGEDFDDGNLYFRKMGFPQNYNDIALKRYYDAAIDLGKVAWRGRYPTPRNVQSGYLCNEGGRYVLRHTWGPFALIPRRSVPEYEREYMAYYPVTYHYGNRRVSDVRPRPEWLEDSMLKKDTYPGMLLCPARPASRVPNRLILFPQYNPDEAPIPLSKEDLRSYLLDFELCKSSRRGNVNFWAMPRPGEQKPVFYIERDGRIFFGMSLFLRIGYRNAISHGLPEIHRTLGEQLSCPLDYPHAVLGFSGEGGCSYRSRVSFGSLTAQGNATEKELSLPLYSPKPSYYPTYIEDGKNYNDHRFRLRGHKMYWMQEREKEVSSVSPGVTAIYPLEAGAEFTGVIRYRNLTDDELGLLLWSLQLEPGCFQAIGMGKPYGLGRMELEITALRELDTRKLYRSFAPPVVDDSRTRERVLRYIHHYDSWVCKKLGIHTSIRTCPEILDFFFLRQVHRELAGKTTDYMSFVEQKDTMQVLSSVREIRTWIESKK